MSYFKKFTDFLGLIGLFFALLKLIEKYMMHDFGEMAEAGFSEKVKLFADLKTSTATSMFIVFSLLLIFYLLLSRILAKMPVIALFSSILPFSFAVNMLIEKKFPSHPMFYLIISALGFFGALYDVFLNDKLKGKRILFYATSAFGALYSVALFVLVRLPYKSPEFTEEELLRADRFSLFGIDLTAIVGKEELHVITLLAVAALVSVVIGLILREVYFIDLILSSAMLDLMIIKWHSGILTFAPVYVCLPILLYFVLRLTLFFYKPQIKKTKT